MSPDGTALACGLNRWGQYYDLRRSYWLGPYLLREDGSQMSFSPDGGRLATFKPAVTSEEGTSSPSRAPAASGM